MKSLTIFLFCADCTWEIIPMLLGAWLIGFFTWGVINRKRYKARLQKLDEERKAMETSLDENKRILETEVYKHKKLTKRYLDLEKETTSLKLKLDQKDN